MSSLTLVIRTRNHARCIADTLRRVHEQNGLGHLLRETVHMDVGSTDGTLGILRQHQPEKLIQLDADRFSEGAALNLAMRTTDSEWVILLSGDALPQDENWLKNLAAELHLHKNVAAVTSRQVPGRGCRDVFAHGLVQRFGAGSGSRLVGGHYSAVSTAVNRAVWDLHPFREDLPGCEVEEWGSRVETLGWRVLMAPSSTVVFSRNYSLREVYNMARAEVLAWSRAGGVPSTLRSSGRSRGLWRGRNLRALARACWMDLKYSFEKGNVLEWPYSILVQIARRLGERRGYGEVHRGPRNGPASLGAGLGNYAGMQAGPR